MPFNEKTGKSKGFAFVTGPDPIPMELQKLSGIELFIEESTSKKKRLNPATIEISDTSDS